MFGLTKLRLQRSRAIGLGITGVVLSGAIIAIATQAKAQFAGRERLAQVAPAIVPDPFSAPSQIGIPRTPTRPTARTRRVPIDPVPMPGDFRAPLPELPQPPDIRTLPGTASTPISGISGKVSLTPLCSVTAPTSACQIRPYIGSLKISSVARDRVLRLNTDPDGLFQIRLIPGMYVVEPDSPNFPIGTSQTITVIDNVLRQMEFNFQGTIAPGGTAGTPVTGIAR